MTANRIGIDLSQDHFDLILANSEGQPVTPARRFAHDRQGSQEALNFVLATCQAYPSDEVWIGAEATGLLWWHLYQQWGMDPHLAELHPRFYLLNPAPVQGFRKSAPRQDKTDAKDARLIARYLGIPDQELHAWQPDAQHWGLRFLTRARFHLVHQLASLKLRTFNMIYLKSSAYHQIEPFKDLLGKTSRTILCEYPNLQTLLELPLDDLAAQLKLLSRGSLADPQENARKLQEVARHSYPLDPAVAPCVHFILRCQIDLIQAYEKQLKALDAFIAEYFGDDPDIRHLQAISGIGPVFAAGLVAELRPTQRFFVDPRFDLHSGRQHLRSLHQAQAAIAKLAGLWWPRNQSGNFDAQDRRLPRACNAYLRYYLVEAANRVRENTADYGLYYQRKFAETKKHPHKRALVLTARKLLRLVFVLLHKHQAYQLRRQS